MNEPSQQEDVVLSDDRPEVAKTPQGRIAQLLLIALVVVHIIAASYDAYNRIPWVDIPIHIFGGLASGYIFMLYAKRWIVVLDRKNQPIVYMVMLLGGVALAGVCWEFVEFGYDHLFAIPHHLRLAQLGNTDTMKDLFDDLFGGLLSMLFFRY